MATMLKIKKDESDKESRATSLNPEGIRNKLFYFSDVSHQFHLDTRSYAEHKALDKLYTTLLTFRDVIPEKLSGYLKGKRFGKIKMDDFPDYTPDASMKLCNEIIEFAYDLYEWAEEQEYCDIENLAQELSGQAAKTIYLLTLT